MKYLVVAETLAEAVGSAVSEDDDVFLVEESVERLEQLEEETRDARVWYLIGSPELLPLPDAFVDRAFVEGGDVGRVVR